MSWFKNPDGSASIQPHGSILNRNSVNIKMFSFKKTIFFTWDHHHQKDMSFAFIRTLAKSVYLLDKHCQSQVLPCVFHLQNFPSLDTSQPIISQSNTQQLISCFHWVCLTNFKTHRPEGPMKFLFWHITGNCHGCCIDIFDTDTTQL